MALAAGTRLGPYEIIAPIGAGGMGEVYRAKDTKLKREVALKVLPDAFASDPERMARFQREAEVLASLNHPNIAQIYGVEDRALVMELVDGESPKGPMPFDEAWTIALQIAAGLEFAHEKGIVHRDLKPANVKVTADGVVKLLDFGLAKAFTGQTAASSNLENSPTLTLGATQVGVILGTASYMAPEQAKGKAVDKRADIWAFGVVLYELLTGERLFSGDDVSDTLAQVLTKHPDLDKVPQRARRLLRECLEKDPKRRLRDIGDAERQLVEEPPLIPSQAQVVAPSRSLLSIVTTAAAVFALALVVSSVHFREKPPVPEVVRFQVPPPEKMNFAYTAPPAISPDGRMLAFIANTDGGNAGQIWVRALDTLEARALPGTENAGGVLFWSPDSRSLVFAVLPVPFRLKRVEISGGPPQTLCEPDPSVSTGAWSRDNVILLARGGLVRVPAAGGDCTPVTVVNTSRGEISHRLPSFLPDGRHFVYLRVSSNPGVSGLYIGSLDAKPSEQSSKRLLAAESGAVYVPAPNDRGGHLLFVREGALMSQPFDTSRMELAGDAVPIAEQVGLGPGAVGAYLSASTTGALAYRTGPVLGLGVLRLTWFDRQGRVLDTALDPGNYSTPALSPDEKIVAFTRLERQAAGGNQDLWLYDTTRGTSTRFTFNPAVDVAPVWSPDGSSIAFASDRDSARNLYNLYLKPATGAGSEQPLLKSSEAKLPTDWSRDGRFLLYTSIGQRTRTDIWVLPMTGDRTPAPYLQTEFAEADGHFSPDGRFVAYQSNASGVNQVYVQPFPNAAGGKWMVSKDGGTQPRWRRDGKELYFIDSDPTRIVAVDVSLGPTFQAGIPRVLLSAPAAPGPFDVSADGQKFVRFTAAPATSSARSAPITVVLNWQAGLKK
jgi:serine/threonine protein kinase/Tol biopolymer transport system component